jgi:hypothetical protein
MPSSFSSSSTQSGSFATVYRLYAAVAGSLPFDPDRGLGGRLLFAGRIEPENKLPTAASVAGAASLGASADAAALRRAMREGEIDFVVTSLEEALRILKNELRKKQPVAVGVSVAPERVVEQMMGRGVLPDLLPQEGWEVSSTGMDEAAAECFRKWGALQLDEPAADGGDFVAWEVDRRPAVWLPRLDGIALAVVPEEDLLRRRWLRLASRYLGRAAARRRGVVLSASELDRFRTAADALVAERATAGEESVTVVIGSER